jgi:hypothetical protein
MSWDRIERRRAPLMPPREGGRAGRATLNLPHPRQRRQPSGTGDARRPAPE